MSEYSTTPIDYRKQVILKAVVTDYVQTAEPVGSHTLVTRYELGVKSATIRNEMAELSELGYLRQPHTSAGRIPSDLGYRLYVDQLMDTIGLPQAEAAYAKDKLAPSRSEVELIVESTCRILSDLSHYTSMATHPDRTDAVISHISVANVGQGKLLAVMVLDNGRVVHELLEFDTKSRKLDPIKATNFLTQMFAGRTLQSVRATAMESIPEDIADMVDLFGKVYQFVKRELDPKEDTEISMEGASYIMQQPEFKDVDRLEAILSVLEQRSALYKLLSSVYLGPEVMIIIGSENPVSEMRDCSFVGTKYRIRGRTAGTIGVVGPTRMDYRRAVGAVEFMARNLGELLTSLSLS